MKRIVYHRIIQTTIDNLTFNDFRPFFPAPNETKRSFIKFLPMSVDEKRERSTPGGANNNNNPYYLDNSDAEDNDNDHPTNWASNDNPGGDPSVKLNSNDEGGDTICTINKRPTSSRKWSINEWTKTKKEESTRKRSEERQSKKPTSHV